jgi:putative FmdB family regulatory protein
MPIYEYQCKACKQVNEFLILGNDNPLKCKKCGGKELVKLMSAHSKPIALRGREVPLPGACCGDPNACGMSGSCCSEC